MTERLVETIVNGARSRGAGRLPKSNVVSERDWLEAVRGGDIDAYAELYSLHHDAVLRLARRLCRDAHEADDVVSDVFCNTLRAISAGNGPRDAARAYLLRSVRHTVTKLRTRKDTGRAHPVGGAELDVVGHDDAVQLAGAATAAWNDVSPRFRTVLWSVEVHGCDITDIAEDQRIAPTAAASLVHRARRALRRAYLRQCVQTPEAGADCGGTRLLLPAMLDDDVSASSAMRLRAHLDECPACCDALEEMRCVRRRLASRGWLLFAPSFIRAMGAESFRAIGSFTAATPAVVLLVGVTGATLTVVDRSPAVELTTSAAVAELAPTPAPTAEGEAGDVGSTTPPSLDRAARSPDAIIAPDDLVTTLPLTPSVQPDQTVTAGSNSNVGVPTTALPVILGDVVVPATDLVGDTLGDVSEDTDQVLGELGSTIDDATTTGVSDAVIADDGVVDDIVDDPGLVDGLTDVAHETTTHLGNTLDVTLGPIDVAPKGGDTTLVSLLASTSG